MRQKNNDHFRNFISCKTILYTISFLGLSWLLTPISAISAENKTAPTVVNSTDSLKLNKLMKVETVVMQGNRPSFNFYIPVPKKWQVNGIDLKLLIQQSPLLDNISTLTISLGDTPLDSIFLNKNNQESILWNVTVPKEYISPKVTTITLSGWFKIGDKLCQDTENKGNWVTISGNSEIIYHFVKSDWQPTLVNFPAPFINLDTPYKDAITLLLPSNLTDSSFFPYFDLANLFSQTASWRGVSFDLVRTSDLRQKTFANPAVLAATADDADFTIIGQPPLLKLQNKQWVTQEGTVLPEDSGFIWLTQYQKQPLLVISSNSTEGLNNTIQTLRSGQVQKMSNASSFFLAKDKIDISKSPENRSTVTFQDLGYKDNVIFGAGQNTLSYEFNLPAQFYGKNNALNLEYSHSPFLEKATLSSISVNLNGVPVGGKELIPNSADINTLKIPLPINQLLVGKNNVTINFMMSLANSGCSKDYLNQAWGIIYQDSNFEFSNKGNNLSDSARLKNWPSLMTNNVLVALPTEKEAYTNDALLNSLISFSSNLTDTTALSLLDHSKVAQSKNYSFNTLFFTTANSHLLPIDHLKKVFDRLLDSLKNTNDLVLNNIDQSVFKNAFIKSQGIGFASIWQEAQKLNTYQMILYGYSAADLNLAVRLLNNSFKRESLSDDLAISFENGSFTSLAPKDIQKQTESEATMKRATQITLGILFCILIVFLALVIITIILKKRR